MHRRQSTMTLGKASPGTPPYDSAIYTISPSSSAHLTIIRHRQHWKADTAPQSAAILSHIWHAAENAREQRPFYHNSVGAWTQWTANALRAIDHAQPQAAAAFDQLWRGVTTPRPSMGRAEQGYSTPQEG